MGARLGRPLMTAGRRLFFYGTPASMATGGLVSMLDDRGVLQRRETPDIPETDMEKQSSVAGLAGAASLIGGGLGATKGVGNFFRGLGVPGSVATLGGGALALTQILRDREYARTMGAMGYDSDWGSRTVLEPAKIGLASGLLGAAFSPNRALQAGIRSAQMGAGIGLAREVGRNFLQDHYRNKFSVKMGSGFKGMRSGESRFASGSGSDGSPLSNMGGLSGAVRDAASGAELNPVSMPKLPGASSGFRANPLSAFSDSNRLPASPNSMSFQMDGRKNNPMRKVTDMPEEMRRVRQTSMGIPNPPKIERPKGPEGPKPPKAPKLSSPQHRMPDHRIDRKDLPEDIRQQLDANNGRISATGPLFRDFGVEDDYTFNLEQAEKDRLSTRLGRAAVGLPIGALIGGGYGVTAGTAGAAASHTVQKALGQDVGESILPALQRGASKGGRIGGLAGAALLGLGAFVGKRQYNSSITGHGERSITGDGNSMPYAPFSDADYDVFRKTSSFDIHPAAAGALAGLGSFAAALPTLAKKERGLLETIQAGGPVGMESQIDDVLAKADAEAGYLRWSEQQATQHIAEKSRQRMLSAGSASEADRISNQALRRMTNMNDQTDRAVSKVMREASEQVDQLSGALVRSIQHADPAKSLRLLRIGGLVSPALLALGTAGLMTAVGRDKTSSPTQAFAKGLKRFFGTPLRAIPKPLKAIGAVGLIGAGSLAATAPLRPSEANMRKDQETNLDEYKRRNRQLWDGSPSGTLPTGRRLGT